ncbi:lipopolysaccharide biosynthesis protein [uncultured Methylobacterium sp.]|uniref:lipopolysaccharide biosynthesis protein n=1 Tax=uncultured Methylobacterium sp. TaxID=157278 RepID=UPI0035CA21AD
MRWPDLGRFGRRFAVILSGELIQSLFHFVLNIALVRELGTHDYGLFAIVFTVGAVGVTYIRALVAVPATLFLARSLGRPAERGYAVVFGSGAALIALVMAAAVAVLLAPAIGLAALAGGAFVGLYAFRSYLRIVLLARRAPRVAGLSDIVYSACGLVLVASLHAGDAALLEHAFLGIAAAHAVGICVALAAIRQPVRVSFRVGIRRRYAVIWRPLVWSLVGVTGTTVQGQGLTLLFALLAGPAAYAPIAATLVLFAPLRIPTNALNNMVLPELSGLLADGRLQEARGLVLRSTALIGLGCLAYGAAMWTALPIIEHYLFKGRFLHEPMAGIGFGVWCVVTTALLYAIPRAFLEASAAFRVIAAGALVSAGIGFLIMVPLLLILPPAFALIGLAVSELATALWSARAFRHTSRRPDRRVPAVDHAAAAAAPPAGA